MSKEDMKYDGGKPRVDLVDPDFISEVAKVLTFGVTKYREYSWRTIKDMKKRYYAAALRHLFAWWKGETHDPESGLHHLAHAACCLMFILWKERRKK